MEFDTSGIVNDTKQRVNKDISVYGKRNVFRQLENATKNGTLLFLDKEKVQQLDVGRGLQLSNGLSNDELSENIQLFWDNFNPQRETDNSLCAR